MAIDLTTEDGAHSVAQVGGFLCFTGAGGALLEMGLTAIERSGHGGVSMILSAAWAIEIATLVVAGALFHRGKGATFGVVAIVVLLIDIVTKLALGITSLSLGLNIMVVLGVIVGIRGVRAMRRLSAADVQGVFD